MSKFVFPSIYYPLYTVHFPKYWFVRDESPDRLYSPEIERAPHTSMLFHVSAGDYITTLATIMRFFEETIKNGETTPEMRELQLKTIRNVVNDLLYLNKHYMIISKEKKEKE